VFRDLIIGKKRLVEAIHDDASGIPCLSGG
jgi:hypothetical protein